MADNRERIFELVRDQGPLTRDQIALRSGLSTSTVRPTVDELIARGAVQAQGTRGGPGRPAGLVSIDPSLATVVGVQFEAGRIRTALTDLSLDIQHGSTRERPMRVAEDAGAALDVAAEMVESMIGATAVPRERILGVAIALVAPVDTIDHVVRETSRLPGWIGLRPAAELERRLQLPTDLGNDATLAGLAEAVVGAATGHNHVVYLKLSAVIGCGIVLGGQPYQGYAGTAGELAHLQVDRGGALCFCGNRGCLWTVIGAERILRELESTTGESAVRLEETSDVDLDHRLERVIELAEQGDLACRAMLHEVGEQTGLAVANVCNLLNPQSIVVGGTLSTADEFLVGPLRATAVRYTMHLSQRHAPRPIEIIRARLDHWAEVQGAGAMVLRSANPAIRGRLRALIAPES